MYDAAHVAEIDSRRATCDEFAPRRTKARDALNDGEGRLNRFVVSLLAMIVIAGALVTIILTWTSADASIERITDFAGFLQDHDDQDGKLILTLAMVVLILLMASVLVLELAASPSQRMRIHNVTAGEVTITTARIGEHIDDAVRGVGHISDCRTTVARKGQRVEVILDLYVDPGADLAQTADEACRRAHSLVDKLGIELASKPRARLHYRELRLQAEGKPPDDRDSWNRPVAEEQRDD